VEELQNSVFVEKLIQKGYEVIFFTEAIDEYVMTHLTEFDDKKFQDASKDDLKLGKDDRKGLKKLRVSRHAKASLSHLVAELFSQLFNASSVHSIWNIESMGLCKDDLQGPQEAQGGGRHAVVISHCCRASQTIGLS
jgi:hypothetical protein